MFDNGNLKRILAGDITDKSWHWLIVIIAAGLLIRLTAAWLQPAYTDEAFNYYLCQMGWDVLIKALTADNHTPALHFLLWPLMKITKSVFLLRLPSVLGGTAAVLLSFHLFKSVFSEREALFLTVAAACGYRLFINDAMIRPYGLLTAGFLAVWLGLYGIRRDSCPFRAINCSERVRWGLYGIAALLTSSLHLLGIIIVAVASVFALQFSAGVRRLTLKIHALAVVPGVLWYVWRMISRPHGNHIAAFSWEALERLPLVPLCVLNLKLGDRTLADCGKFANVYLCAEDNVFSAFMRCQQLSSYHLFLYMAGAALWLLAVWGIYRLRQKNAYQAAFCAAMVFGPLSVFVAGVAMGYIGFYSERYFVPFTVPFLMLLNAAFHRYALYFQRALLTAALAVCLAFPWSAGFLWVENWHNVISYIEANHKDGDIIVLYLPNAVYSFAMAYDPDNVKLQGYGVPFQSVSKPDKLPWFMFTPAMANEHSLKTLHDHRIFLIISMFDDPSFDNNVIHWFDRYCVCEGSCWAPSVNGCATHTVLLYSAK